MLYYVENFPEQAADTKVVYVNNTFHGMDEVLKLFKVVLNFPYPYSSESKYNYYAFRDIMEDLYWLSENEVRIVHESLPSLDEEIMGYQYLDVLNLIDVEWERFMERAGITRQYAKEHPEKYIHRDEVTAWWERQPKIFNVYFRKEDESYVKEILQKYSKDYRKCIYFDEKGDEYIE